jgi:hypothetical protein
MKRSERMALEQFLNIIPEGLTYIQILEKIRSGSLKETSNLTEVDVNNLILNIQRLQIKISHQSPWRDNTFTEKTKAVLTAILFFGYIYLGLTHPGSYIPELHYRR